MRPLVSISEFLEDSRANFSSPEPIVLQPKAPVTAPVTDLLDPQDTHPLRLASPMESEAEEESQRSRLEIGRAHV